MRRSDARQAAFHRRIHAAGFACHVYERSHLASDGYLSASVHGAANDSRKRPYSWEAEQENLAAWLAALPKPIGIMACYDVMGLRVLDACRRSQIAIPEQVAVIGVDNDELLCDLADPPLTSIAHDIEAIGYESAALLDRMMRGENPPERPTMLLPRGIVLRKSTDIVAVDDKFVARALSFIRQRACSGITVAQVAGHVGMRRRSLERRFQVSLGRTPGDEIARVRLEHIKTLLTETDFTLEAIAHKTGFKDASSVSVFFANQTGQAPGRYRNTFARVAYTRLQAPGFRAGR
jgi:LacI family transcriptional regulator